MVSSSHGVQAALVIIYTEVCGALTTSGTPPAVKFICGLQAHALMRAHNQARGGIAGR